MSWGAAGGGPLRSWHSGQQAFTPHCPALPRPCYRRVQEWQQSFHYEPKDKQ